jgi:2-polyprenyl-3-methyl-5-hydroxy-6-metoxy-1,4-benzoquinol methylase
MSTAAPRTEYLAPFDPDTDFDRHYARLTARRIRPWLRPGDRLLELGCATGLMTSLLAGRVAHVDAVDRSAGFLARAAARDLPNATFHRALVEEVEPAGPYDHVVAAALLNELEDPAGVLRRCRGWVGRGGLVHVTMTNPRSLHRLLAVEMGLLAALDADSARGATYDTRQLADGPGLERLGAAAGLRCLHREPVLLKPLANAQLEAFGDAVVEALDRIAHLLPEHGAITYAVFSPEEDPGGHDR